uniref:Glutathione transferase n=1 Tax=Macrostomum lignano TaxID=282301 RepID=A0A1I8IYL7_9PLAT
SDEGSAIDLIRRPGVFCQTVDEPPGPRLPPPERALLRVQQDLLQRLRAVGLGANDVARQLQAALSQGHAGRAQLGPLVESLVGDVFGVTVHAEGSAQQAGVRRVQLALQHIRHGPGLGVVEEHRFHHRLEHWSGRASLWSTMRTERKAAHASPLRRRRSSWTLGTRPPRYRNCSHRGSGAAVALSMLGRRMTAGRSAGTRQQLGRRGGVEHQQQWMPAGRGHQHIRGLPAASPGAGCSFACIGCSRPSCPKATRSDGPMQAEGLLLQCPRSGRADPPRPDGRRRVEFDDVRFTREEWPEKKKIAPTGVAPWVETPNGKLVQSGAIARFIAKKHGLYGEGDWEFYLVERALAQIEDVATELMKMYFAPEDKKAELVKQFQTEKGPKLIEGLLKFIEDGGSGFFAGKSVTLADLASVNMVDQLALVPELLAKFPQLEAHKKRVLEAKPKVAEWIKNRPQTPTSQAGCRNIQWIARLANLGAAAERLPSWIHFLRSRSALNSRSNSRCVSASSSSEAEEELALPPPMVSRMPTSRHCRRWRASSSAARTDAVNGPASARETDTSSSSSSSSGGRSDSAFLTIGLLSPVSRQDMTASICKAEKGENCSMAGHFFGLFPAEGTRSTVAVTFYSYSRTLAGGQLQRGLWQEISYSGTLVAGDQLQRDSGGRRSATAGLWWQEISYSGTLVGYQLQRDSGRRSATAGLWQEISYSGTLAGGQLQWDSGRRSATAGLWQEISYSGTLVAGDQLQQDSDGRRSATVGLWQEISYSGTLVAGDQLQRDSDGRRSATAGL